MDTECNYDYSEFTDHIGTDIYIPYCAVLLGVLEMSNGISSGLLVDLVSYDTVVNNYRAFLGPDRKEDFDTDIAENPDQRTIFISGKLKDGDKL